MDNSTTAIKLNTDLQKELYQFRLIVSICGTCISTMGYCLMVMTALLFPAWRRMRQNQLWLHMCGSYLIFFYADFYTFLYPIESAFISAIVDHLKRYIVRVSMMWMLAGAWLTYKNLVDVFADLQTFMLKASLLSWVLPIPIVAVQYVLYFFEHPEHVHPNGVKTSIGCNLFAEEKYRNLVWILQCLLDNSLLVIPVLGSLALYSRVAYSIYKNRKVYGHERDLASTVALGFFFVFTCCVQCAIISAKYMFFLEGMWTYVTIFLMAFHVTTYTTLFVVCNKVSRNMWIKFFKTKVLGHAASISR